MAYRSYFYRIYDSFRQGNYDQAINAAMNYRTNQPPTGFRRIYNYLSRLLETIEQLNVTKLEQQELDKLARNIARMHIQIAYQENRGVLPRDLAEGIKAALAEILQHIRAKSDEASRRARALRDALDAVLAYVIVAPTRREEEFL